MVLCLDDMLFRSTLCILSFHFGDLLLGYQVLVIIIVLFVSCRRVASPTICFQLVAYA